MTKGEIVMLVIVLLFVAVLLVGMNMIKAGSLETMTFWTAGVMGIMAIFGLIAAFGFKNSD